MEMEWKTCPTPYHIRAVIGIITALTCDKAAQGGEGHADQEPRVIRAKSVQNTKVAFTSVSIGAALLKLLVSVIVAPVQRQRP